MVEISVILPVYNSEEYLEECLNALVNQTFEDIEILCINDGSKDNSLDILKDFEKKDKRVKVFDQENVGVARTRNNALKKVNGNYVYFMDSDDYLELDALEKLYNNVTNNDSDFCLFRTYAVDKNQVRRELGAFNLDQKFQDVDFNNFTFNCLDVKEYVLNDLFAPWFKLYKKEFLFSDEDFVFPETASYSDTPFHVKTMLKASKISFVPEFLYNYRFNPNSLVHNTSNTNYIFTIIDIIEDYLKKNDFFDTFKDEFYAFKITKLVFYAGFSDSEEYYLKAKEELEPLKGFADKVEPRYAEKMDIILESDNPRECYFDVNMHDAEYRIEHLQNSYDSLKTSYNTIKFKYNALKERHAALQDKYNALKENYISVKEKYSAMKTRYIALKHSNQVLKDENEAFRTSTSWQITKPLRKISGKK